MYFILYYIYIFYRYLYILICNFLSYTKPKNTDSVVKYNWCPNFDELISQKKI